MRTLPQITSVWQQGGPFIGDNKPVTRVFVQLPWPDLAGDTGHEEDILRTTESAGIGTSIDRGVPFRWFQNQANDQDMVELPNVLSVEVDRSIDQDAATFSMSLSNQWMYGLGLAPSGAVTAGQPGYFTPTRGSSMDAQARWGHTENEWSNVLVPNALIRIYTGFGGADGDVLAAVAAGDLCLYGIFLIDEVRISTNGKITINGRDMAKLLIDQQLFPPLVPADKYPLSYERWTYERVPLRAASKTVVLGASTTGVTEGDKNCVYKDSSADRWYGHDASIYGHRGSHSVDGSPHTYALSVGNSGPDKPFATDWWEYECGEVMNAVYVYPWAGGYELYVSVMVGGAWQGTETVPYDAAHLQATQSPAVDTGADIPYVAKFTVPHETPREYLLPQAYNAERVRISFRHLYYSGLGTWKYRAGVREVRIRGVESEDGGGLGPSSNDGTAMTFPPYVMAAGQIRNPDNIYSQGYITATNFGQSDAFGDARRIQPANNPMEMQHPVAVRIKKDGVGYYILDAHGNVRAHGSAVHYGDPKTTHGYEWGVTPGIPWDMALTPTGEGYWILNTLGTVWCYGDATDFNVSVTTADPILCSSMESHPTDDGFWILRTDGKVFNFGAATHWGDYPEINVFNTGTGLAVFQNASERAQCIRCNSDGTGYWILTSNGGIGNFGYAKGFGGPERINHSGNIFTQSFWEILPAPDDRGYLLVHASGNVYDFGDVYNAGSAVPGTTAELRSPGNYLDYSDIARDLALWSGFLFYDPAHPSNQPAPVYGALETTGAFSDARLPDEMFDKRPVIDALTQIREVVGYVCWVDAEGRFRWESPNWWKVGNFDENGNHVATLLEVDERLQLTGYSLSTADDPLRSSIIISSHDPYADYSSTITHTFTPPTASRLRGIVKPAMWINEFFVNANEQAIMAELIGLHISFQERVGQVECVANPAIEINDQVRIFERQTEEVYVHYVRGVHFSHDLESNDYRMTLTTHWLAAGTDSGDIVGGEHFTASVDLQERIAAMQYGKTSKDPGGRL